MKELAAILGICSRQPEKARALATLVKASGSTYRRPGARMLVLQNGESVGFVSGGCLERDLIEKGQEVAAKGEAMLVTYDTSAEEDIVFGAGLGCKGTVHILVEPVGPGSAAAALIRFIGDIFQQRRPGAVATILQIRGEVGVRVGQRLMLDSGGKVSGQIDDAELSVKLKAAAGEALAAKRGATMELELTDGGAEVFTEVIRAPARLVIFGAGYDAVPLCRLAHEVGFHVTVADARPAYAQPARFPEADSVVTVRPEGIAALGLDENTCAVLMSHNYLTDRGILQALLPLGLRYLGVMGPRVRALKMLEELHKAGMTDGRDVWQRIHNPVGLDIGADSPEQIALAILAEIQAVTAGRAGGLLREKQGSIHGPTP